MKIKKKQNLLILQEWKRERERGLYYFNEKRLSNRKWTRPKAGSGRGVGLASLAQGEQLLTLKT